MRTVFGLLVSVIVCVSTHAVAWTPEDAMQRNFANAMKMAQLGTDTIRCRAGVVELRCTPLIRGMPGYVGFYRRATKWTFVEIDARQYPGIFASLTTGSDTQAVDSFNQVKGSAIMQGLIPMPGNEGE